MDIDPKDLQLSVDYIAGAQPLLQKAAETEAAVAAFMPELVDKLIKRGFIEADARETAIKNLQDPVRALKSLEKLAEIQSREKTAAAPQTLGSAERSTSKTASNSGKPMKESDKVFLSKFGFNS